jgi:hypothetical protein
VRREFSRIRRRVVLRSSSSRNFVSARSARASCVATDPNPPPSSTIEAAPSPVGDQVASRIRVSQSLISSRQEFASLFKRARCFWTLGAEPPGFSRGSRLHCKAASITWRGPKGVRACGHARVREHLHARLCVRSYARTHACAPWSFRWRAGEARAAQRGGSVAPRSWCTSSAAPAPAPAMRRSAGTPTAARPDNGAGAPGQQARSAQRGAGAPKPTDLDGVVLDVVLHLLRNLESWSPGRAFPRHRVSMPAKREPVGRRGEVVRVRGAAAHTAEAGWPLQSHAQCTDGRVTSNTTAVGQSTAQTTATPCPRRHTNSREKNGPRTTAHGSAGPTGYA